MSETYKCLVCSEWHAMQEPVTFGGIEIRECPNFNKFLPNWDVVALDRNDTRDWSNTLEHILGLPKTCQPLTNLTPASNTAIPDFGEPKKFL